MKKTNKVIRHFFSIMLVSVLMLGLAGCGEKEDVSNETIGYDTNFSVKSESTQPKVSISTPINQDTGVEAEPEPIPEPENTEPVILKYDPTEEILNAKFTDFVFQIDDILITYNYTQTVTDFIAQFDPETYEIDGNLSALLTKNSRTYFSIYNTKQPSEKGKEKSKVMSVTVKNDFEETTTVDKCSTFWPDFNLKYEGSIYFAKGIPFNLEDIQNDDNYSFGKISDYLRPLADDTTEEGSVWGDFVVSNLEPDKTYFWESDDKMNYVLYVFGNRDYKRLSHFGHDLYPAYSLLFEISNQTAMCRNVKINFESVQPDGWGN